MFQGSSAILNTLLTLINERTFRDGRPGSDGATPLISVIGSSNEIPNDPALSAFSDRFLLRCRVRYVGIDELEDVLLLGWQDEQQRIRPAADGSDPRSRAQVTVAPRRPADAPAGRRADRPVPGHPARTWRSCARSGRAGIKFSDRRAVKAQKVFAASALLARPRPRRT